MIQSFKSIEKLHAKDNLIHFQTDCKVLHEVRIFNKKGKLKKTISERAIHKRQVRIAERETKKKGGFNACNRKIQKSCSTE